ncbi:MAG: glycosyltransferase 87 family protein, partial [Thermoleophilia bacterium]
CLLFLLPFFDLRRPLRIFNLDLLMLLSFTVSHYFFNQGEIFRSVPLSYPPLAYLFLRLLWTAVRRVPRRRSPQPPAGAETDSLTFAAVSAAGRPRRGDGDDDLDTDAAGQVHLNFPPLVLAIGLAALIIFRITINIADSNVVDVGYSGVIGAHRIIENQTPYGHMASDDQNGDTYGPLNYLLYVPFERTLQWSGKWDDLPAAHAAAIFFDLVTIAGMFMAGRSLARSRRAGNRLGLALAYAWAAFPYTTFVLNCNVNDTIQAAFLVWGFVFIRRGLISGLLLGLGMQIKFFPAMLGPLWASFPNAFRNWKRRVLFVLGLVAGAAVVMPVVFMGDGSLHTFLQHSIEWQWGRQSPFSLWGQYPDRLARVQHVGQYVLASLAVLAYFLPWKKNRIQLAAASAALVIGFQILQTHWFYLYIPWFFPLAMIALMVASGRPGAKRMETGLVAG